MSSSSRPSRASLSTLVDEGDPAVLFGPPSGDGTSTKRRKNRLSLIDRLLGVQKRPEISIPYDTVHLTHVGFNSSTGEFTGLPKEWQELLSSSGISRRDQERNPEAVMEVVRFYQEVHGDPWEKTSPPPNRVQHSDLGVVPPRPPRPPKPDKSTHPPPRPAALNLKSSETDRQVPPHSPEKHDPASWEWLSPSRPAPPPPSSSSPTSPAPSWYTRPTVSHDRSQSQPAPLSPLPQPEVARSRSQRDIPHATRSPLAPPMLPPIIPSLPLDHPTSQRAPPSPLPQPRATGSKSQRDRPHPPSATRSPPAPTVSSKKTVQDPDKEVAPPRPAITSLTKHTGAKPDVTNQSSHVPAAEITSLMTPSEVIAHLGTRGCPDLGDQLDEESCSKYPISNGGYGDIYRAKLKNGTEVAIKTMRLLLDAEGQKHIKHAARELYTWSKCRHRNVQQLLGLLEFRDQIGMVSVWEVNGDLSGYLQRFPETDRYQISAQIAEGLAYLHQNGIAHGDLKGSNILVSVAGVPLLSDFGNATLHEYTLKFTSTATKSSISVRWAAPELIKGATTYSAPADVYALGMEAITGTPPWTGKAELAVIFAVVSKECPQRPLEHIPADSSRGDMLWTLLKRCWLCEPGDRPSASEVKDFMQGIA